MENTGHFPGSSIGRKVLMASSGLVLAGFVLGHMLGNLKIFQGPEKLDAYAHWLREFGQPALGHGQFLWIMRLILLAAVGTHIWAAVTLSRMNRSARPVGYRLQRADASSYASRTMIWGGIVILLFVVYHILHLTTGNLHPDFQSSPYANVVAGFQVWWVSAIYLLAQAALGFHLYHGFWSMFRTLGFAGAGDGKLRAGAWAFAMVVALGNASIPSAVLLGIVG